MKKNNLPFVGVISKEGYIEHYTYQVAEENDFHAYFCLTEKGGELFDDEETLVFTLNSKVNGYENTHIYITGNPSLDPLDAGRKQITLMCDIFRKINPNIDLEIYAEKLIGTMKDFK